MRGQNAQGILGVFAARDYGVIADGQIDDAAAIRRAVQAALIAGGGQVWLPSDGSAVAIGSTILLPDDVELVIPAGCTLRLIAGSNCDMIANSDPLGGNSRVRISAAGVIDGNRANQGAGNWHGIHLVNVTDPHVDSGITVQSCRGCGVLLSGCTRAVTDLVAIDNGIDGIDLLDTVRSVIRARAYDNCRVAAPGDGDGIHLEGASTDNVIIAPVCYDTLGGASRQGYGVREDAASACDRNLIVGGSLADNLTGETSLVGANSKWVDNAAVLATAGLPTALSFGSAGALGVSTKAALEDHEHPMQAAPASAPTDYPYLGFGSNAGLSAEVDIQSMQLVNEIIGWPVYVPNGTNLATGNLWLRKSGTMGAVTVVDTSGEAGITDNYEQAIKALPAAANDAIEWVPWIYANEPRVKAGKVISAMFAVWCVGGTGVTAKLVNSDASETAAAKVNTAAWNIVKIENHALAGASCKPQFIADGAGTFYVVPLGVCIGPRALVLPPRPWREIDISSTNYFYNANPSSWEDVDMTSQTSPLAFWIRGHGRYTNNSREDQFIYIRRNGSPNSPEVVLADDINKIYSFSFNVFLDDGQVFEVSSSYPADTDLLFLFLHSYREWS